MPKKRTITSSDDDVFHVEVITGARVNDDAEWEYRVSWAGYSSEDDSWEPAENVEQCDRLLRSFWRHVGMDNHDYAPGDQFDAQEWWIEREREYFANMWRDKKKKKKRPSRDRHYAITISNAGPTRSKKGKKNINKSLEEFVQQQNDTESDDASDDSAEIPLSRSLASKAKGKAPANRRRKGIQPQDEDSDANEDEDEDPPNNDKIPPKGKRPSGVSGTSQVRGARSSNLIVGNKRKRLSTSGDESDSPSELPRKFAKTSQPTIVTVPATPPRPTTSPREDSGHMHGSPSSLFSAPSSPAPAPSSQQPVAPKAPTLPMPAPSGSGVVGPPKNLLPPKPAGSGSQPKAVRKPAWLLEPKIKRFDAPNLKPGSTLPTKASLGAVKTLDTSLPSTSARRSSIQTPTEAHTPMSPSIPGGSVVFGSGSSVDAQHHDDAPQSADALTPTMQDVPRLPPASRAETEAFLSGLMPPEISGPMIDGVESNQPPSAPVRKSSTLDILKNTSIPRKFKWSGELRVNIDKDRKERLCNVVLSDASTGSPSRLRFSICFGPSVSFLLLEKLFSVAELQSLRPSLTPVAEVARIGPDTQADENQLTKLFRYMISRNLVSCSGIYLDDNQVALLLVFPATQLALCKEYNVRLELRKADHFIAALLPWRVVGTKARAHRLFRDPGDRTHDIYGPGKKESIVMTEHEPSLRKDPSYHRDLSILGIPRWLYDEVSESTNYCIWNKDGDGTPSKFGFETRALSHILDKRRARNVGFKRDVSFVFVHVGAIKTLNQLPALMERRMKRLDIQFVTYGTHHTIPPARWGMRLIYPAGGIACISPSVFAESPSTAYRLLDMLEQHPLWDCFVTPGVVALAARQNRGSDPISELEKGTLIHQDLLSRIGQGQLSLLSMEPPHYGSKEGPVLEWIRLHQQTSMLEPRGILEDCLRSFSKKFSDFPEETWTFNVLKELSSVLCSLQQQPCTMDEHRRFVVITGEQDKIAADWCGREWTNVDTFSFRDEFFSKEKLDDLRSWAAVEHALRTI